MFSLLGVEVGCNVALKSTIKVQTLPETPLKNLARHAKRLAYR